MQYVYYCLVFLSTVSVAVLFEVKKVYVIERDFKTGVLRARRQNIPVPSHTVARIGGLQDHQMHHHHHNHMTQHQQQQQQQQNMFTVAVSPPPLQSLSAAAGGQQQLPQQQPAQDLASTVDLTTAADSRAPIDYLTPPPSADFQAHNYLAPAAADATVRAAEPHPQFPVQQQQTYAAPVVGFSAVAAALQAQPPPPPPPPPPPAPLAAQAVQTSSPSNQVHSLTFASPPLEQFTPYKPTLAQHDAMPAAGQHHQHPQNGGRWELGFDANDILTPPFAVSVPEQAPGGNPFYQQDFGQESAASSSPVRNNKQFVAGGGGGGGGGGTFFGGGGFDAAISSNNNNNNKFTPSDAVVRTSSSNKNVYWGTPKSAQQLPLRPPALYNADANAYRFNSNSNNNHHHHHHQHQYVDPFQMPFTGQFDGPLSQGTVADHVVHSSFRIKRQLEDGAPWTAGRRSDHEDEARDVGDRKPVYSYVKTDRNGNFKWSVRQGY